VKPVIGLIGGMGSGKSAVASELARRGARVISGDDLGHQALGQADIRAHVVERWGERVLDPEGKIDRRRLAAIVFADPRVREALEALVHPWIEERIKAEVENARTDPNVKIVVLDAAIMLEAGWGRLCDRLVYVDAPEELRRRRVAEQRGWTATDMAAREEAQLPLTEKRAAADHVLDNSAGLAHLERQVDELVRLWGVAPETSRPCV